MAWRISTHGSRWGRRPDSIQTEYHPVTGSLRLLGVGTELRTDAPNLRHSVRRQSLLKAMEGGIHNTMNRSFAVYGSVTLAGPSASSKKTVASVRVTKSGSNSDPDLPEVIALRCKAIRLTSAILDNIRSSKYNNADEFKAAYMELCSQLELDAAQVQRYKGFVCRHHLVPRCNGGDDSVQNLRPFTFSSHVLIHIVLAAYWPNKPNLQYAVKLMITGESRKDALPSFPEEVLAAIDAAVTKSNAERSRSQALLA